MNIPRIMLAVALCIVGLIVATKPMTGPSCTTASAWQDDCLQSISGYIGSSAHKASVFDSCSPSPDGGLNAQPYA